MNIKENAIEYTAALSKINSFNIEGKREALKYAQNILSQNTNAEITMYDFDTDAPFLIASVKGSDSDFKLLLEGHLDVVSPEGMENPFSAEIKDGIMYGRGVADMKGGCGAIISAFIAAANDSGLKGQLYLMLSTDEEYAGEEIKTALSKEYLPKVDFAMISEPTNLQIHTAHKGEAWMEVEFFGKSAHSSIPHLGKNAIYMAAEFIIEVKKLIATYKDKAHPIYGEPAMSVGVIEGGSTPNVVPPYAKVTIDKRYLPGGSAEEFQEEIDTIINKLSADDPDFKAKATTIGNWNSVLTDRENKDFLAIKGVIDKVLGSDTPLGVMTGWGEGGFINMYGIPVVYFGPGDFKFAHTPNEQIPLSHIEKVTEAYYNIVKKLCF